MSVLIEGNDVLVVEELVHGQGLVEKNTYTLVISPVPRHEVRVSPFAAHKLMVWDVVNTTIQLWVGKDVVNDHLRVAVPKLVLSSHPFRCGSVLWPEAIVPSTVRLPRYVVEFYRVDS